MFDFPLARRKRGDGSLVGLLNLNTLFEDLFKYPLSLDLLSSVKIPRISIIEKGNSLIVRAELPGVDREDIDIAIDGDLLTISGEKKQESETKEDDYYQRETSYGRFQRTVALPSAVKEETAKAKFKGGVLVVELQKTETKKKKKISIEAA